MNIDSRRQGIIHYLAERDLVSVNTLIEEMGESPATIRRDLRFLEENGVITRSHGYAKYVQPQIVSTIPMTSGQRAVGALAASLIPERATVMIDSGISAVALAEQIAPRDDLSIITNSLSVAEALASSNNKINLTGGLLIGRQEALIGPDAETYVRSIRVPYLFVTTTGIRPMQGLVCVTPEQCSLKHAMIESADHVVLLADSRKMNTDSVRLFASFSEINTIITDMPINNPEFEDYLKSTGVEVLIAPAAE